MLKYLIIQLDDTSPSFCHYSNNRKDRKLIPLDKLEKAILWSMKENLNVQVLYPEYEIPDNYMEVIDRVDHTDIVPSTVSSLKLMKSADVVVFNSIREYNGYIPSNGQALILRINIADLISEADKIVVSNRNLERLNIVITDVPNLSEDFQKKYGSILSRISEKIEEEYVSDHPVQVNILTDRIFLDHMNNCNAGHESIALAPDGKYYICPAFYLEDSDDNSVGDVESGPKIPNARLYKIENSPICRICDAYHCRRCVWMNRKLTLEVNTPSKEQCIMSHLERNASKELLIKIRTHGDFMPKKEFDQIEYLDPLDKFLSDSNI